MARKIVSALAERQEWLKPAEEPLQSFIHKVFSFSGGQQLKNFLHGTWVGHPLHVILTDVPIGAWTAAVIFDSLDSMSGRRRFSAAADTSVALGIVGAVGATITGITDWQDIDPPARRVGLVHGLLNLASVALFGSSLIARRKGARDTGRGLAALGYAVSATAAHLGGDLVFDKKIGVDHSDGEKLPEKFARVTAESELKDSKPFSADYKGTPILLVRRGSQIYALAETCSHLGGPLSEGKLQGDAIQCPWHGSRFSIVDGQVLDGPAVHPQPCLEVRIRDGQIEVRRSDLQELVRKAPASEGRSKGSTRTGTER